VSHEVLGNLGCVGVLVLPPLPPPFPIWMLDRAGAAASWMPPEWTVAVEPGQGDGWELAVTAPNGCTFTEPLSVQGHDCLNAWVKLCARAHRAGANPGIVGLAKLRRAEGDAK